MVVEAECKEEVPFDEKFDNLFMVELSNFFLEQAAVHPSFSGSRKQVFNHSKHKKYFDDYHRDINKTHSKISIRHFHLERNIKRITYQQFILPTTF